MSGKSVLVADDDADVLTALMLRCEQLGLDVAVAGDAMTALMMFQINPPDLLIIDVNMPRGNGISVCEMLAADAHHRDIPLIVLTGRSDDETIARCRRAGVHYVFKKGDVWERIKPLVRSALGIAIED
ncbi:MAG: response regulator [Pirellulales bacterium]